MSELTNVERIYKEVADQNKRKEDDQKARQEKRLREISASVIATREALGKKRDHRVYPAPKQAPATEQTNISSIQQSELPTIDNPVQLLPLEQKPS